MHPDFNPYSIFFILFFTFLFFIIFILFILFLRFQGVCICFLYKQMFKKYASQKHAFHCFVMECIFPEFVNDQKHTYISLIIMVYFFKKIEFSRRIHLLAQTLAVQSKVYSLFCFIRDMKHALHCKAM